VGDFLLASISVARWTLVSVTPPSGWHLIQTYNVRVPWVQTINLLQIVSSEDLEFPSYYQWDFCLSGNYFWRLAVGGIIRYTGIDPTLPVDTIQYSNGITVAGGGPATAPSVTTRCPDDRVVTVFGAFQPVDSFSTPEGTNYINYVHYHPEGDKPLYWVYPSLALFDAEMPAPGASGDKTTTMDGTINTSVVGWATQTIALKTVISAPPSVNITGNNNISENSSGQANVSLTYPTGNQVTVHCEVSGDAVQG
jgi:hypothetical protein